ncbi:PorT family protein [candidate division WOR-3 bacterium]|nr:PorT family protein [candidate division WOR-3 bacterium]
MKKITLAAIILTALSIPAFSQLSLPIHFGVKAGLALANGYGEDIPDSMSGWKPGFYGGAYANYGFTPMMAVQGELLFTQKGVKYDEDNYSGSSTLNYINIPILLRFNVPNLVFGLSFLGGVDMGINVGATWESEANGVSSSGDIETINTFDLGAAIGAEACYQQFLFELRYVHGLTNVNEEVNGVQPDAKNMCICAGIGYQIM